MVRNRAVANKTATKRNGVKSPTKTAKKTIAKPGVGGRVVDARQRIIQKKRTTVVDARDVLANMAKTQDARQKLQKLRGQPVKSAGAAIKAIGKHILQKTDKNGKISLVTKKKAATNINAKIREQLGMQQHEQQQHQQQQQRLKKLPPKRKDTGPLQIRRTIANEYSAPVGVYYPPDLYHPHHSHPAGGYSGISPMLQPVEMRRPPVLVEAPIVRDAASGAWKTYSAAPTRSANGATGYMDIDSDEDGGGGGHHMMVSSRPGMQRGASNVLSRLDDPIKVQVSHGILAQQQAAKTKVVVPAGHRIVVSNLQSSVTQDDIRELFEDIGQLLVARLVRPGTAEVIYKNLKDAQKAVDTYHNRQLDGQPMKCLLVNKRPLNNPTAPAIKNDNVRKPVPKSTEKLIPDLNTIHKVLFQRH